MRAMSRYEPPCRDTRSSGSLATAALALAMLMAWAAAGLAHEPAGIRSLKTMMAQAELVFHGVVENIEYVLSEPAGPEQVRVPYTLVTYRIAQVFHGQAPGTRATLRFLGGLDTESMSYMASTGVPQFDVGDEDILFVQGNTERPSPLVGNRHGRLRLIGSQVYSEAGRAVVLAGDGTLRLGARYRLPEVETTTVAGRVFEHRTRERDVRPLPSEAAGAADLMRALADLAPQVPDPTTSYVDAKAAGALPAPDMTPALPPDDSQGKGPPQSR